MLSSTISLLVFPFVAYGQSYTIVTTYQGDNFFNQWNFSTDVSTNYGNAAFQPYSVAAAQNLTYIASNGNAIVKIDNTTVGNPNDTTFGRASVYMTSNAAINTGSLILMDAVHAPFGCSVWPGYFTEGAGVVWPQKGEIDIFENVNQATTNQYSLHTLDGCTHPGDASGQSGTVISTDCYNATNGNQGCIVRETKPNSYGAGFNSAGGGSFAVLYDDNGIKQWFFPRGSAPSDFTSSSPNPANWGLPSAYFPASSCNMTEFFGPQTMILNIDICGSYALGVFANTCQGNCLDLVRTPSNYDEAYFEISFIKVFTEGSNNSATAPIPGNSATVTTTQSSSNPSGTGAALLKMHAPLSWIAGVAGVAGLFTITAGFASVSIINSV